MGGGGEGEDDVARAVGMSLRVKNPSIVSIPLSDNPHYESSSTDEDGGEDERLKYAPGRERRRRGTTTIARDDPPVFEERYRKLRGGDGTAKATTRTVDEEGGVGVRGRRDDGCDDKGTGWFAWLWGRRD